MANIFKNERRVFLGHDQVVCSPLFHPVITSPTQSLREFPDFSDVCPRGTIPEVRIPIHNGILRVCDPNTVYSKTSL